MKIKTNIKFKKNEQGRLYGFVSKKPNGSWIGCREEYPEKKKIVLVDADVENGMIADVLYSVNLVPMKNDNGFVVVSASQKLFKARIETELHDDIYRVSVKFGNKTLVYDPTSNLQQRRSISQIADLITKAQNLKDRMTIANEFTDSACLVQSLYNRQKRA